MGSPQKSIRAGGPELLRIVSMLFIVAHHYSAHGPVSLQVLDEVCPGTVFLQLISVFGGGALATFPLLSGYFMVKSEAPVLASYRRLVPLTAQLVFYSFLFAALSMAFGLVPFSAKALIRSALPLLFGGSCWYVYSYIWFCLLVPFLNRLLRRADARTGFGFVLALQILWCAVPTFTAFNIGLFGVFGFFFVWYCTGAYLRLHAPARLDRKKCGRALLALTLLQLISVLAIDGLAVALHSEKLLNHALYFFPENSLLASLWAVALFLYFRELPLRSAAVNAVSRHVLAVYLIHDNEYVRRVLWSRLFSNAGLVHSWLLPLHALGKVAAVFLLCVGLDTLREATLGRLVEPRLLALYDRFARFLEARVFPRLRALAPDAREPR